MMSLSLGEDKRLTPEVRISLSKREFKRYDAWNPSRVWNDATYEGWLSTYLGGQALEGSKCVVVAQPLDSEARTLATDPCKYAGR